MICSKVTGIVGTGGDVVSGIDDLLWEGLVETANAHLELRAMGRISHFHSVLSAQIAASFRVKVRPVQEFVSGNSGSTATR